MYSKESPVTIDKLKSAIVPNPLIVTPNMVVMDVIAQMSGIRSICPTSGTADSQVNYLHIEARSSCVLVVENKKLVGILTERDVVKLSVQPRALDTISVGEVMTSPVVTLRESNCTDFFFVINLLQEYHIRHLPIVDVQDHLVGLVTHETIQQIAHPINLLKLRSVAEIMTKEVIYATSNVTVAEVARLMTEHRISSVILIEERRINKQESLKIPIGILTERDIVQFQALNLNLKTYQAQAVMSTPIFTVSPEDSLLAVQQTMKQRFINRVVVIGIQGELLGIITQTSLLQALNPLELYKLTQVLEGKVLKLEQEKIEFLQNRNIELETQVELRTVSWRKKIAQEKIITDIAFQIRSSLNLSDILNTAIKKIQQVLECSRVAIWQIKPDSPMMVVAESVREEITSILGLEINASCFIRNFVEEYRQGKIRVVPDIYTTEMAECHREFLEQVRTRSKVLVPIINEDNLWGILETSESHVPRQWQPEEINFLQQIAIQLGIAIGQANSYEKLKDELVKRKKAELELSLSNQELEIKIKERTYELQKQKNRLQDLFDNATDLIQSIAPDGQILFVNKAWKETLGYDDDDIKNLSIFQIIHPDELVHCQTMMQEIFAGVTCLNIKTRFITKDRQEVIVEGNINCHFQDGKPMSTRGIFRDITQREKIEKELSIEKNESAKLAAIVESSQDAIISKTLEGIIVSWNKSAEKLFGYSAQEIIGQHISRLVPLELRYEEDIILQKIKQGETLSSYETKRQRKDGTIVTIELTISPIWGDVNSVIGVSEIARDITKRKEIEEENKKLSNRLTLALESGSIGYFEWNITNHTKFWDHRMYELYDFFPDQDIPISSEDWANCIHPDDRIRCKTILEQSVLGQAEYDTEFRVVRSDGSIRFLKAHGKLIIDSENNSRIMIGINIDITDRKKDEIALLESQQFLQAVLNSFPLAVFWKDKNSVFLGCNQLFATLLQVKSPLEVIGKTNFDFSNIAEIASKINETDRQVIESGKAKLGIEHMDISSTGEVMWSEVNLIPLLDHSNIAIVGTLQDITKRKIAEQEQNRLLNFLDASLNEIYLFEASTLIFIYINQGGIKNLGYDIETLKTMTPLNIKPDFNEIEFRQLIQPLLQGNLEILIFETRHQRVDGSYYSVEVRLQQHKYLNKQYCLAVIVDITERKKAEMVLRQTNEELIRATRLKDEFLANMSHELRTPLNAILGMSEILEEEILGSLNQEQIRLLQTVRNSGEHLLSLINDILDVAKIESGEVILDLMPTSIDYLCTSSIAFIKQQAIQKNITIQSRIPANLPKLSIDERRIRQVLINLLTNAVKFTLDNGQITLEVKKVFHSPKRNFLRIAVSDTGIGISKDNIDKLFKPFIQIDSALNRQYTGTGLGLALVKRIVELHGGQVGVTSELNVGSCFTIDLPITISVADSPKLNTDTEQSIPLESNLVVSTDQKSLILLAEDNEANIITFSCYLKAIGYQLEIARNGREAIDLTRICKPDLILMDISMPGMDGLEAIKQIRLNPNWVNIPIIALTALAMPGDRERCLEAGANRHLQKTRIYAEQSIEPLAY